MEEKITEKPRILVVDDEPAILDALSLTFENDYEVIQAAGPEEALAVLEETEVAVIIADQRMPRMSGSEVLKAARELQPDAVRIILSAYTDIEDLIAAINAGEVWRYLVKPWESRELKVLVHQAVERHLLIKENQRLLGELARAHDRLQRDYELLQRQVEERYRFDEIIGRSSQMQKVFEVVRRVADSVITVLLLGETGTGKELIARALHYNSSRRHQKFLVQNCGALPDNLLESELFGHKRGSFTGAVADKKGLFEEANSGTVFLDEIAETSPAMQVRLLRVLQEGEIKRVGENEPRKVDVRVIAATNRDLEPLVAEGRFREDLYYRLNVISIRLPPLRERPEDIPLLVHHFIQKATKKFGRKVSKLRDDAMRMLEAYPFPGNVRELENEIERAVMLCEGDTIVPEVLSDRVRCGGETARAAVAMGGGLMAAVDRFKRRLIEEALAAAEGNKTRAAEILGLSRQSLQQMMKRLQIEEIRTGGAEGERDERS